MNKKLLIMTIMLALAAVAFAQPAKTFLAELTGDSTGVIITKYNGNAISVNIPATLEGLPVKGIGKGAFKDNIAINKITINKGVTEIQADAFKGCRGLSSIILPDTLVKIGPGAFDNTGLAAITIPAGCKELGDGAFANAGKLKTITLPASFTTIPANTFSNCIALTTVGLPASIKKIDSKAFSGCTALTAINIPASVTAITFASDVFVGCSKINLGTQVSLKKLGYTGTF